MKIFEQYSSLLEIRAKEANSTEASINTLIKKQRPIGFISTPSTYDMHNMVNNGINMIQVPSNPHNSFVIYLDGHEAEAKELLGIAEKYKGYLSPNATEEEQIRIGRILRYDERDIQDYVNRQKAKATIS
jgi:hypothetical protein